VILPFFVPIIRKISPCLLLNAYGEHIGSDAAIFADELQRCGRRRQTERLPVPDVMKLLLEVFV
jgi:hypothetical protein